MYLSVKNKRCVPRLLYLLVSCRLTQRDEQCKDTSKPTAVLKYSLPIFLLRQDLISGNKQILRYYGLTSTPATLLSPSATSIPLHMFETSYLMKFDLRLNLSINPNPPSRMKLAAEKSFLDQVTRTVLHETELYHSANCKF
jgi:hypothetical protein